MRSSSNYGAVRFESVLEMILYNCGASKCSFKQCHYMKVWPPLFIPEICVLNSKLVIKLFGSCSLADTHELSVTRLSSRVKQVAIVNCKLGCAVYVWTHWYLIGMLIKVWFFLRESLRWSFTEDSASSSVSIMWTTSKQVADWLTDSAYHCSKYPNSAPCY